MANKVIAVELANASRKNRAAHKYTVAVDGGEVELGFSAKVVQTLPQTGEKQYLYLVPKEGSTDDAYDEWIWAVQEDGTYDWEHIGSTNVHIEIDTEMSDSSENPVQNKVIKGYVDQAVGGKQDTLTAGTNVSIDNGVISATDTTYTAGTNVAINNGVISATDTTYAAFSGTDGSTAGTAGLVPAPTTSDGDKYLKGDGTWETVPTGPTVVQTTGESTTSVMSQKAVTDILGDIESTLHAINNGEES